MKIETSSQSLSQLSSARLPLMAVTLIALSCAHLSLRADIITFNGLTGPQGLVVSAYSEGSYTVTSTAGTWGESHMFGNPVPSIYTPSANASVEITRIGGGTFSFFSVDLGKGANTANFQVYGFLNNNWIFGISSGVPNPNSFATVSSYNTTMQMDMLRISFWGNDGIAAVDNIVLNVVPEPGSLCLVGMGMVLCLLRSRRV